MTPTPLDPTAGLGERRHPVAMALGLAGFLALFVCLRLGNVVATTAWTMDADEAVHTVEALRLYEHLEHGRLGAFVRDSYFPERWHPPVDPHVRWYPPVHAWCVAPFFAVLGPSDFSARLPSVFFLFGTCLVFFLLARRLAVDRDSIEAALSGLLAVFFVLAAPNLLTFAAQSVVASASVFFCFLALLAYLWSLEANHPRGRALTAGVLLGVAMLTKYDHGGVLALCLGGCELWRARANLRSVPRSGAALMLGTAALLITVWFAHPDKLAALGDSLRHPFLGSPRTILLDFFLTWIVEYAPGITVGVLAFLAVPGLRRRLSDPALRAVWVWGVFGAAFYALRGRYHFRYNIVEAPIFLLLLAVVLPEWVRAWREKLLAPGGRRRTQGGLALWFLSALGLVAGLFASLSPGRVFELLRGPAAWFTGLRDDRWGLSLSADEYVDYFSVYYSDFVTFLGGSFASASIGLFVLATAILMWRSLPAGRRHVGAMLWASLGVAIAPGFALLHGRLSVLVEWELEGIPELASVQDFVVEYAGPGDTVLLGGGWDQLTNNGLRWHRATRSPGGRLPLAEVEVTGDMIGSVVFPPEPRIAWWAARLATAPIDELPALLVFVEPGSQFLYHTRFGPEVAIYDAIAAQRGTHREIARHYFPVLDATVRILRRTEAQPLPSSFADVLARHGIDPADPPSSSARHEVGQGGWVLRDESLRHFIAR